MAIIILKFLDGIRQACIDEPIVVYAYLVRDQIGACAPHLAQVFMLLVATSLVNNGVTSIFISSIIVG